MYRKEFGNGIYITTDEDKEMIKEHVLCYKDLFYYGNYLLDNCFEEVIADYKLTIYSNLYKILELLDTLKVMTENGLIESGFIVLRSLVECSVQLSFILSDSNSIEKRAIVFQMYDIKRTSLDEINFYTQMKQVSSYIPYITLFKIKKPFDNWYSYSEERRVTIKELFEKSQLISLYDSLYRPLCLETHVALHMESNIVPDANNKFNFKPFRMFENHILLIHSILKIIMPTYTKLIENFGDEVVKKEWVEYKNKTINYLESNDLIIDLFTNTTKWF